MTSWFGTADFKGIVLAALVILSFLYCVNSSVADEVAGNRDVEFEQVMTLRKMWRVRCGRSILTPKKQNPETAKAK
jgi:hypothetical protein